MVKRILHFYWRFARGLTLGVQGCVLDGEGKVLLVRHGYVAGWHFPGGGVETGETFIHALARELIEECNVTLAGAPVLHGIFQNIAATRRDHVAVYVVREFRQDGEPVPDREIIAHGFFAPDALPEDATRGTRARIAEVMRGAGVEERW